MNDSSRSTSKDTFAQHLRICLLFMAILLNALFIAIPFGWIPWVHDALQGLRECHAFRWIAIPYVLSVLLFLVGSFWPSKPIHLLMRIIVGVHVPLMLMEGFLLIWLLDCSGWGTF